MHPALVEVESNRGDAICKSFCEIDLQVGQAKLSAILSQRDVKLALSGSNTFPKARTSESSAHSRFFTTFRRRATDMPFALLNEVDLGTLFSLIPFSLNLLLSKMPLSARQY
jgi:hypothetical protein